MVKGMVEFVIKNNVMNFFVRILPLFTLFLTWSGVSGVKQYAGIVYVYRNKITCILGLIIIFGELLLKSNWKYKFSLNVLGNLFFWIPLFYGALSETNNISDVTVLFYISFVVVMICCILQLKTIYTNKS